MASVLGLCGIAWGYPTRFHILPRAEMGIRLDWPLPYLRRTSHIMLDRTLSPWWFALVVIGFAGAGYFRDGRFGAVEGAVVAVVLAHGALLEALREEREERRKQEAEP